MPLTPGQRLGTYEIVCPIGAGGMGEVYRARDTRLGRDVALKVLPPEVTSEPGRLERFDREARAIAALNHPHIVTIYSTEEADGIRFLTMELVEGSTLAEMVTASGMPLAAFLEIAVPLTDALAAAHQKQITHRDLKPGNVMMSNDRRVKVLDFGLARVGGAGNIAGGDQTLMVTQAPVTHEGMILGTIPYMSPEQAEGRPIDGRGDLFSLGVIFYELLSGRRPFSGSSPAALMSAILRDTPANVRKTRPDVPASLDRLLARMLEKRPDDRVQTAREVVDELRDIQRSIDVRVGARPPSASSQLVAAAIAVAPFVSRSADNESKALAEGLTEDLATNLARFGHLRVVGRADAARYVVEGSVRSTGSQRRATARLVDHESAAHLWAETFDRDAADPFVFQDEMAARIAATIADEDGVIVRQIAAPLLGRPLDALNASELVIRFHVYTEQMKPDEHARLMRAFERRLEIEPTHPDGWAGLAALYGQAIVFGLDASADTVLKQLRAAERAIELDPKNQLAWFAMGMKASFARDIVALRDACDRAVAINPLSGHTTVSCAAFLSFAGDFDRGLDIYRRTQDLNPHHQDWYFVVPMLHAYHARHYDDALRFAKRITMPAFAWGPLAAAAAAGQLGLTTEAKIAIDTLKRTRPELIDPEAARADWRAWLWHDEHIDHMVDGLRKANDLLTAGMSSQDAES